MKYIEKIRCEYSQEGLSSLRRPQRRGFVVGEKNDMFLVLWDGLKTPTRYAKRFITADPLIDLVSLPKPENKSKYPIDLSDGRWIYVDKKNIVFCSEGAQQKSYTLLEVVEKIPLDLLEKLFPLNG